MSFILRKKPSSGAPRVSQEAAAPTLPADLVAAGGRRLALLGLISASVTVLMSAVDWHTFGRIPLPAHGQTPWLTANIAASDIVLDTADLDTLDAVESRSTDVPIG